jgi:hypothetical protein
MKNGETIKKIKERYHRIKTKTGINITSNQTRPKYFQKKKKKTPFVPSPFKMTPSFIPIYPKRQQLPWQSLMISAKFVD